MLMLEGGNAFLESSDARGQSSAFRMEIVGARKGVTGSPEREVPGRRNYLTAADPAQWRTGVRLWEQVRFTGVLDGVDVVYRGGGHRFEYDLVLAPGVSARTIRISIDGANGLNLSRAGDLTIRTAAGGVIQRRPVAYQMEGGARREVAATFRLHGKRIGFDVGAYDHSKPLIIDPIIDYATWAPGSVTGVAVDGNGSAYITGAAYGPFLPVTGNAYQKAPAGSQAISSSHMYVARFSADGSTLLYCTYLGGSGSDTSAGIVLDSAGNAVIGGITASPDFPLTSGAYISRPTVTGPWSFRVETECRWFRAAMVDLASFAGLDGSRDRWQRQRARGVYPAGHGHLDHAQRDRQRGQIPMARRARFQRCSPGVCDVRTRPAVNQRDRWHGYRPGWHRVDWRNGARVQYFGEWRLHIPPIPADACCRNRRRSQHLKSGCQCHDWRQRSELRNECRARR